MSRHLQVAFTLERSAQIRAEADARKLTPQVLVAAAIAGMLDGGLVDAVFDGADPHEEAGGQGRHVNGLTHLQCAVLYLARLNADRDGICHFSAEKYAQLAGGASQGGVQNALMVLVARGLMRRVCRPGPRSAQPHVLTQRGWDLSDELAEEPLERRGRGGEG